MASHQRSDKDFARDLNRLSLGEARLKEFGDYPLFLSFVVPLINRKFFLTNGGRSGIWPKTRSGKQ
jgi:hypothetical protein